MKLINIDLGKEIPGLPRPFVGEQWALVRLHGAPIGILPLGSSRSWSSAELADLIASRLTPEVTRHLVLDGLADGRGISGLDLLNLPRQCPQRRDAIAWPPVTVAVCTRDGGARIAECLDALDAIEYPRERLDVIVVDNAPLDTSTRRLVTGRRGFRYVVEARPGLDWARNRAILEARGDIIAFTDDDASVDAGWVTAIARLFATEPDAMCVTGLVVPDEIDVRPQALFESYGGFGRGFRRIYAQVDLAGGESAAAIHGGTGKFGTGANMAFRRELFDRIGRFDPALDVGTPTNGGGDLEMFFRTLKHGYLLVYEPAAIVRHRHRRTYHGLRTQLANNGIGFYSYLVRSATAYRDERAAFVRLGAWWLWTWNARRLMAGCIRRRFPCDLIAAELIGSVRGLWRYRRARARAAQILATFGPQQPLTPEETA